MSENLHTVTVEVREGAYGENEAVVSFTCSGTRDSDCHVYPDSEEWEDGDGQERVPHDECWLQGWIDNDMYDYVGDDRVLDWEGSQGVPPIARTAPITAEYEYGGYMTWKFEETPDA